MPDPRTTRATHPREYRCAPIGKRDLRKDALVAYPYRRSTRAPVVSAADAAVFIDHFAIADHVTGEWTGGSSPGSILTRTSRLFRVECVGDGGRQQGRVLRPAAAVLQDPTRGDWRLTHARLQARVLCVIGGCDG